MKLEELYSKWKVRPCKVDASLVLHGKTIPLEVDSFEHSAPLGDLIKDYTEHLSIPWWRRSYDWKFVETHMRGVLNRIHIVFYGRF